MLYLLYPTQLGDGHENVSSSLNEGSESKEEMRKPSMARKQVNFQQGEDLESIFGKKRISTYREVCPQGEDTHKCDHRTEI